MLKKLNVLVLVVSSSYAMEDITPTLTGNNCIKKIIEEIKQKPDGNKNETNINKSGIDDTAEQFDNLNIDETLRQMNSINDKKTSDDKNIFLRKPGSGSSNKNRDKKQSKNISSKGECNDKINIKNNEIRDNTNLNKNRINLFKKEKQHDKDINPNKLNDNTINIKNNKMFNFFGDKTDIELSAEDDLNTAVMYSGADDIEELLNCFSNDEQYLKTRKYKDNWTKIEIRSQFAQVCQKFLQKIIKLHKITEQMMSNFCNSDIFFNCVKLNFEPFPILEEVYTLNINMDYISKSDIEFLNGQMYHLSRFVPARTKKIKQHLHKMLALQEQLQVSETEASQIYWDSYWSNYHAFK